MGNTILDLLKKTFGRTTPPEVKAEEIKPNYQEKELHALKSIGIGFSTLQTLLAQQSLVNYERFSLARELSGMLNCPYSASTIDAFANSVTTPSPNNGKIVWVDSKDSKYKEVLEDLFNDLSVDERMYDWAATCLRGDTRVPLLDGSMPTIREMAQNPNMYIGKKIWSVNPSTKKLELDSVVSAFKTKENAELVRVVLDNGKFVDCTPDHRFMLRNGSFSQAKDLVSGQSLMPLYSKKYKSSVALYNPEDEKWYEWCDLCLTKEFLEDSYINKKYGMPRIAKMVGCHWKEHKRTVELIKDSEYLNHKVVSVDKLECKEDVYDLTIEKNHNFPTEAGVFVHNCGLYGDLFLKVYGEPGVGIKAIDDNLHPTMVGRVDHLGRLLGFYRTPNSFASSDSLSTLSDKKFDVDLLPPWEYVHFRLLAANKRGFGKIGTPYNVLSPQYSMGNPTVEGMFQFQSRYGTSLLFDALVPYKRYRMGMDAITMARLVNSPITRVWKAVIPECLVGSTKVRLMDGTTPSLKEMAENKDKYVGKSVWTINETTRQLEVGKIKNAQVTRKNAQLVRVLLDNDEYIDCTPDHRFMLRDGSYREAKDLISGTSLMPMYRRFSNKGLSEYPQVYNPRTNTWHYEHRMALGTTTNTNIAKNNNLSREEAKNLLVARRNRKCIVCGNAVNLGASKYCSYSCMYNRNKKMVLNHKVISVISLSHTEDTYDLTIDGNPNFPLASGVFVHNSASNPQMISELMASYRDVLTRSTQFDSSSLSPNFKSRKDNPSMMEALLIPVYGNKENLSMEEIGGKADVKWIADVELLEKQYVTSLKVPMPLLAGHTDSTPGGMNSNSYMRIDIRFARQTRRLQQAIIKGLTRLCQIHLAFMGLDPNPELFEVRMNETSSAEEVEMQESLDKGTDTVVKFMDMLGTQLEGQPLDKVKVLDYMNRKIMKLEDFDVNEYISKLPIVKTENSVEVEFPKNEAKLSRRGCADLSASLPIDKTTKLLETTNGKIEKTIKTNNLWESCYANKKLTITIGKSDE